MRQRHRGARSLGVGVGGNRWGIGRGARGIRHAGQAHAETENADERGTG